MDFYTFSGAGVTLVPLNCIFFFCEVGSSWDSRSQAHWPMALSLSFKFIDGYSSVQLPYQGLQFCSADFRADYRKRFPEWTFSESIFYQKEQILFKAQQHLFVTFLDIMPIFGSIQPQSESTSTFLNIIIFQKMSIFGAPSSTLQEDRHMHSPAFLYEIQRVDQLYL